jgi:hypothetical protein
MLNFGIALIVLGVLSFLLPVVGLQLKGLHIFGEYRVMVGIGAIALGAILVAAAKLIGTSRSS